MERKETMVRFLTFEQVHNRHNVGSTRIRVHNLIKYWPEADLYKYGEFPDTLIFQKVYCSQDYKFPAHFENTKILDVCDPDWLHGHLIKETVDAMDGVTCPTESLAKFLRQLSDKPVKVIPDRFDTQELPPPKVHHTYARKVVWFGYRHNAELLKSAIPLIDELDLELLIISDDDPLLYTSSKRKKEFYEFRKYDEATIYKLLQTADFAILPEGKRPQDRFKSNNKTIKAILAGLPVAKTSDEVRLYMDGKQRQSFIDSEYAKIKKQYDVRLSVKEMKEFIKSLK